METSPGSYLITSHLFVHDDVIKWKHFPRYWPFVRGIHRSPVTSPHKGQWGGALMFSLICGWIKAWVNNREVGDLRRHRANYDVTAMTWQGSTAVVSCATFFLNDHFIEIDLRAKTEFPWNLNYDGKRLVNRLLIMIHSACQVFYQNITCYKLTTTGGDIRLLFLCVNYLPGKKEDLLPI